MVVDVQGGDAPLRYFIEDASQQVLERLMPGAYHNLHLTVEVIDGLLESEGVSGDCLPEDDFRSQYFDIRLDYGSDSDLIARTLVHELVHVKQYATGELRQFSNGRYRYKREVFPRDYAYHLRPWEIEASSLERQLLENITCVF